MAEKISANTSGEVVEIWDIAPEDMARVSAEDFRTLQDLARRYCRVVDSTRSRKRMDGSATVAPTGRARSDAGPAGGRAADRGHRGPGCPVSRTSRHRRGSTCGRAAGRGPDGRSPPDPGSVGRRTAAVRNRGGTAPGRGRPARHIGGDQPGHRGAGEGHPPPGLTRLTRWGPAECPRPDSAITGRRARGQAPFARPAPGARYASARSARPPGERPHWERNVRTRSARTPRRNDRELSKACCV